MKNKIIFLLTLILLLSVFLTLQALAQFSYVQSSKSITCGNNICEATTLELKIGQEKSIDIAGKTYSFKLVKIEKVETPELTYKVYLSVDNGPMMLADEAKEKTGINFNCCGFIGDANGIKIEEGAQINFGEDKICAVPDCAFKAELNVYKKWNLIPFYFIANEETLKKGSCKLQDFIVVYAYNPTSNDYTKIYYNGATKNIETSASDFQRSLEPEKILAGTPFNSVWLYSNNECKLAVEIPKPFENFLLILSNMAKQQQTNFASGWNFFIGSKDMGEKSFDEIKGNCAIEKAYTFDARSQSWKKLEKPPGPADNFIFKVTNKCMLGLPEIAPPEIPA